MLEASEADIRITAGRAHVVGVPGHGVRLADVAREAVRPKALMPDPGLNACVYFNPETVTRAVGANAAAGGGDIRACGVGILQDAPGQERGQPTNPQVGGGP